MKTKKNILIIPPFNPYPLISGGHQAVFNGIAILKEIANVYLMISITESQYKKGTYKELQRALPFVTILPYIDPCSRHTIKWYWKVLWNKIFEKLPKLKLLCVKKSSNEFIENELLKKGILEPIYGTDEAKHKCINHIIQKHKIDIVQTEMISNLRIIEHLPKSIKTIFVHHELKYVRDRLLLDTQGNIAQETLNQWQTNKEQEISLLNQYNHVITLSQIDTDKLAKDGVTTDIVTSLAVVEEKKEIPYSGVVRKILSYVGPEMHYPNYEGVMWFLNNCWKQLLAQDPEFSFQIIGKWSDTTKQQLESEFNNVKCVGFVDDLASALDGTTMIVPLNIGSGIRMKILEAAQFNTPVVSTTVGCEGLPLKHGVHLFIADTPDNFIKSIINIQDKSLREQFVIATKTIINKSYSIEKLKESRLNLYI